MQANVEGLLVVLVTALDDELKVDAAGQRAVAEAAAGVAHGLVVGGSTGEGAYLPDRELVKALEACAHTGKPLWGGVLRLSTRAAVVLAKAYKRAGAAGLMVGMPRTFEVQPEQELEHISAVHDATGLPILYYHYPDALGTYRSPEELARIMDLPGVAGMKDTTLSLVQAKSRIKAVGNRAAYMIGTTLLWPEALFMGSRGAVCPLPMLEPRVHKIWNDFLSDNRKQSLKDRERLAWMLPIMSGMSLPSHIINRGMRVASRFGLPLTAEKSPVARIKEALRLMGLPITCKVTPPLPPLTKSEARIVAKAVKERPAT